jgi:hypothetical protein
MILRSVVSTERMSIRCETKRQHAILEIYQLVLAVFLFASPWLFAYANGPLRIDTWICAGIVVALSAVDAHRLPGVGRVDRVCLGLWIAVSPWVLGFQHTGAMFINLSVGILIVYLALLELWLIHYGSSSKNAIG